MDDKSGMKDDSIKIEQFPTEPRSHGAGNDTEASDSEKAEDDPAASEFRYGWCGWTPSWMQRFNRSLWLLIFLCACSTVQSLVVTGYLNSNIATIERRFELSSNASGFIISMYDITCAVLVLFVTYLGGRGHKPKWLAWGMVIMGTGSAMFALPHFTTGLYQPAVGSNSILCRNGTSGEPQCEASTGSDSSLSNYFYLFLVAQVFHGIGALPIYTLGLTLLDESVTTKQTGLYLGLFLAFASVGPAVGHLSSAAFLGINTDLQEQGVKMSTSDPAWVGAWWIGFVISALLAYIVAIPMGGYPTELPETAKIRAGKVSQAHIGGHEDEVTGSNFGAKLGDVPKAFKFLLVNPTFVCLGVAGCADVLLISGFGAFAQKILGIQFAMSPSFSAVIVGALAVPAAVGSTILGGWLIKRLNLKVRGMIRLCLICVAISVVCVFTLLLVCTQETVAGINTNYYENDTGMQDTMKSPCNEDCGCDETADYSPVCGDNNVQYFDACHAGCKSVSEDEQEFSNCTCLGVGIWPETSLQVTPGKCPVDCGVVLPLFLVGFFFSIFFNILPGTPATNASLRCVPDTQRSFSLGIRGLFFRLLGSVPGPILFGNILDTTCLLWQDNCGTRGACWFYDRQALAWKLLLLALGCKGVSLLFYALSLILYKSAHDDDNGGKRVVGSGEVEIDQDENGAKGLSYKQRDVASSTAEIVKNAVNGETAGDECAE